MTQTHTHTSSPLLNLSRARRKEQQLGLFSTRAVSVFSLINLALIFRLTQLVFLPQKNIPHSHLSLLLLTRVPAGCLLSCQVDKNSRSEWTGTHLSHWQNRSLLPFVPCRHTHTHTSCISMSSHKCRTTHQSTKEYSQMSPDVHTCSDTHAHILRDQKNQTSNAQTEKTGTL